MTKAVLMILIMSILLLILVGTFVMVMVAVVVVMLIMVAAMRMLYYKTLICNDSASSFLRQFNFALGWERRAVFLQPSRAMHAGPCGPYRRSSGRLWGPCRDVVPCSAIQRRHF